MELLVWTKHWVWLNHSFWWDLKAKRKKDKRGKKRKNEDVNLDETVENVDASGGTAWVQCDLCSKVSFPLNAMKNDLEQILNLSMFKSKHDIYTCNHFVVETNASF